jgi:hypothetical protein
MGPDFQRSVENMGKKIGEVTGRAAVVNFLGRSVGGISPYPAWVGARLWVLVVDPRVCHLTRG